ncbi:MAG: hypothetical protein BWX50_01125 [Euryarchaeota archaeon ADurb.Bin009]|nr:MAG: hypothetical protein BWX50_01125 [Euryarchaeota archaeon ADurb.Bin009]
MTEDARAIAISFSTFATACSPPAVPPKMTVIPDSSMTRRMRRAGGSLRATESQPRRVVAAAMASGSPDRCSRSQKEVPAIAKSRASENPK